MASSSRISCFQCQDSSSALDHFKNGWRLRSGDHAQLCPRCASVYEEGKFCETFHLNHEGWRDCESCGKLVHCGCIVSFNNHLLLDFGGIICMECSRLNFLLIFVTKNPIYFLEFRSKTTGLPKKLIISLKFSLAPLNFREDFGLKHWKARNRCLSIDPDIRARELNQDPSGQAPVEAQLWPRVTDLQLQQVSRNPKATATPLFEKILTASDSDLKLARLIIPKRCAEAFFPDISGLNGLRIKIQDTEGNEWEFQYRYWLNGGSRIYVLEGLRDIMVSKKMAASYFLSSGTRGKGDNGIKKEFCWLSIFEEPSTKEKCEKQPDNVNMWFCWTLT
ncbi:b3 domain-containing transcription repressor val2 [Phtheirospermum japonicum]|uniref:B3 domain-containing transcription repressor val2 n=1 Tax=Phtheirospermum japonicum TaxID=374723 RepID=A0A830B1M1_9LAMI|nr:b3 domain-containing transcription repressor val2 [Phtheirospermum japonicum]